jgi:hypothetical protein
VSIEIEEKMYRKVEEQFIAPVSDELKLQRI